MGLAAESDVEARAVPVAPGLRAVRPLRVASAVLLVVAIGVAGYLLTTRLQERDREDAAKRRAQVESVGAQGALADARSAVASLGNVLAGEPDRSQRRFAQLAGGSAGSVGLIDAVWVQRIPAGARRAYERRLGAPITRLAGTGFVRAPPAPAYLPASFTTATRMELRSGVDVSTLVRPAGRDQQPGQRVRRRGPACAARWGATRLLPSSRRPIRPGRGPPRLPRRLRPARAG